MPEPREPEPYQPPTVHRAGVPDLSAVPTFLRRGVTRPAAPEAMARQPGGTSIRGGLRPRGGIGSPAPLVDPPAPGGPRPCEECLGTRERSGAARGQNRRQRVRPRRKL